MRTTNLTILEGLQIGKRELKQASAMPLKKAEKFLNKKGKLSYRSTTKERADLARKAGGDLNHPGLSRGPAHSGTPQSALDRHSQLIGSGLVGKVFKNTPHHIETAIKRLENDRVARIERSKINGSELPEKFPMSFALQKLVHPKPVFGGGKSASRISDSEANNFIRGQEVVGGLTVGDTKTHHKIKKALNKKRLSRLGQFSDDKFRYNLPRRELDPQEVDRHLDTLHTQRYNSNIDNYNKMMSKLYSQDKVDLDKAKSYFNNKKLPKYIGYPEEQDGTLTVSPDKLGKVKTFPYKNDMEHMDSVSYASIGPGSAVELQAALRAARDPEVLARRKSRANHARTLRRLSMNSLDPAKKAKIQAQLRLMMGR